MAKRKIDYDAAVAEATAIVQSMTPNQLRLGELGAAVATGYGDKTLAKFANVIGVTASSLRGYIATHNAYARVQFAIRPAYSCMYILIKHPERVHLLMEHPEMTAREARALMTRHKRATTTPPTANEKLAAAVKNLDRAMKTAVDVAGVGQSPEQKKVVTEMALVSEKLKTAFEVCLEDFPEGVAPVRLTPEEIKTLLKGMHYDDLGWLHNPIEAMRWQDSAIRARENFLTDKARSLAAAVRERAEREANWAVRYEVAERVHPKSDFSDLIEPEAKPIIIDGLSDAQIVEACEDQWADPSDYSDDIAEARRLTEDA